MRDSKTVLLTLGRLPVALEIARAFHAAGYRVIVAEPWGLHLAKVSRAVAACFKTATPRKQSARYRAEIESIARREKADLIIPISEETLHISRMSQLASTAVFGAGPADTLRLHDKLQFAELAAAVGLRSPETTTDTKDCRSDIEYVIKPRLSCGGRDVRYANAGEQLSLNDGEIAQVRVHGREISVFCIARDGVVRAMSCYGSELRDGVVAVAFESIECPDAEDWSRKFVRKVGHTGFIAFDFIIDDAGTAWPIECNPRATSGIHLLSPQAIVSAIVGEEIAGEDSQPALRRMEFYSCLTRLFSGMFDHEKRRQAFRVMRSHRDVTWSRSDPLPFLLMMIVNWRLIARALIKRTTFAQASVADLEWRPRDA